MNDSKKIQRCLVLIKSKLKKQGITYQQLADSLKVSVPTIKRQLNSQDIAFSKLIALCQKAGLEFSEIWQQVDNEKPVHTYFSDEQDGVFFLNPHLYQYFFELFFNEKSPDKIQSENDLKDSTTYLYLRKLEDLKLIRVSDQNKVSFLVKKPLGFSSRTKFALKEIEHGLISVANRLTKTEENGDFVVLKPLKLPEEIKSKMLHEMVEIVSKYAELSENYFCSSNELTFNLLICGYDNISDKDTVKIINVTDFL